MDEFDRLIALVKNLDEIAKETNIMFDIYFHRIYEPSIHVIGTDIKISPDNSDITTIVNEIRNIAKKNDAYLNVCVSTYDMPKVHIILFGKLRSATDICVKFDETKFLQDGIEFFKQIIIYAPREDFASYKGKVLAFHEGKIVMV